ncbi:hypothetical protein H8E07_20400 [bacterium]|nr:hypothetical protein [bacterium]
MRFVKSLLVPGCILAVLALTLAGNVAPALADNLLSNGDFETGDLTDWLVFGQDANANASVLSGDNGPSAPGTHNAFLDNQAETRALLLKQSTPAGSGIAGTTLYSFDLKLDQADVGGVLFVNIFAEVAGGGVIGGSGLMGPFWPWNDWVNYSGSFVAPANTDFLTIQIEAVTGANPDSNCRAHVDNVVLDQGTVAAEEMNWSDIKALYR